MKITSSAELVDKALKEIKTITIDEAHTRMIQGKSNIIDIRDIRELQNEGKKVINAENIELKKLNDQN